MTDATVPAIVVVSAPAPSAVVIAETAPLPEVVIASGGLGPVGSQGPQGRPVALVLRVRPAAKVLRVLKAVQARKVSRVPLARRDRWDRKAFRVLGV